MLDGLRQSRGGALDRALSGEPRLIKLLKPLVETPTPGAWQVITLQQLVESFAAEGPEKTD